MKFFKIDYFNNLFLILSFLENKKKITLIFIIFAITISSFLEVLSIGSVLPFASAIMDTEIDNSSNLVKFFNFFKFNANNKLFFTSIFVAMVILSNVFRIFTSYLFSKFSKIIVSDLAVIIYKNNLYSGLSEIKKKNINSIVSIITEKLDAFSGVVFNLLNAISSLFLISVITIFLFFVNFKITLFIILFIALFYFLIILNTKIKLIRISKELSYLSFERIKKIKETFSGFRQVSLDESQNIFFSLFKNLESRFRIIQYKMHFLNMFPRFVIESIVIISIVILIYYYNFYLNYKLIEIIPLAGIFVFAGQKLIPLFNTLYNSYTGVIGYGAYIKDIYDELPKSQYEQEKTLFKKNNKDNGTKITFNKNIIIENLYFKYENNNKLLFDSFNLEIKKGEKCLIVGKSGVGKTTLLDIFTGMISSQRGRLLVDDIEINLSNLSQWKKKIAYVSQDSFLFDESISHNISLELDSKNIDYEKLIASAKLSELYEVIMKLPNGLDTIVGENGTLLSGGQKQRLSIARALYKKKEILILDEATNALDEETETRIIKNISVLKNITIIKVTHKINKNFIFDKRIDL
jgi:ATP-binding cassette subfamily B protein